MAEGGTAVQELTILEGDGKTGDGGSSSKTVAVTGFSLCTSHDVLEMYFENTRRSGGGDIEEIEIKDDVAYITFEEPEVVQRVISHSPHHVAGQTLSVTVFCPPPQKACYENRVLVQRLNSAITEELLTNFLETETGMKVTELLYGEEEGKVVVTFSDCIDFTALRKSCNTRRLQGTFLQVTKVAISNCIFVKALQPSASHDVILFYFENKRRSGGGDVERMEMNIAERYCLVYFEDLNVIDTVLCQQHKIDGTYIKVHLHHECLGRRSSRNRLDPFLGVYKPELKENLLKAETSSCISSNPDVGCDFVETPLKSKTSSIISSYPDTGCDFVETPKWQEDDGKNCVLPLWIKYKMASERTILKDIKKIPCSWNFHLFWNFFTKTKQGQNMLDDILKTCGCSVTVSSDDDDLFIYEIPHESFESKSDLIYFIKDTLGKVYACAQQSFFSDIFLIDHRMLEEFLQRLKQTKEIDNAWIELVGEQEPDAICVVCTKKDQEAILHAVTAVRTDVQDCFENHEEVVIIDTMWQKVLRKFGYLQELGMMFLDLTITPEETKSTIMLKGPRDQSKAAADHLMKLLGVANSEVKVEIFSPGCQFEIFSFPEMCCYIDNSIIQLPIVFIPNHMTKKIHLFSKKSEQVMSMDKLIKGCIKERLYPLPENESVWSPQIVSSLQELKEKNKGKIVINLSPTGLLLTTADDIFESVDTTVQMMFSIETGKVQSLKKLNKRCEQLVNKFDNKTSEKQRKTEDSLQSDQDVTSKHKSKYSKCIIEPHGNIGILNTKVPPEIKVKSNSDGIAEMEYKKKSDVQTLELCSEPLNVEHLQPQGNRLSAGSTEIKQDSSWSKDASDLEVFYTKENIKVAVYNADILNLPVDCIVNAANDRLQHGGGVAKVIADAAGSELVQEGDAIIRKMGMIPVGFQVTTTAGRLPYRCVIHTVGPFWSDYQPHTLQKVKNCEDDLYAAIYGCFIEAEKNGISTVGLPAVSSGIYAVPKEMCAVQYAKAVLDYSKNSRQGQALKEIHFIDKLPHLVNMIQDTFRKMIVSGNVPSYNIQNYVVSSSGYQRQQSKANGRKGRGTQNVAVSDSHYETTKLKELSPHHYEKKVHGTKQFVFQVSAKPVVHIYEADILKLTNVDAIV